MFCLKLELTCLRFFLSVSFEYIMTDCPLDECLVSNNVTWINVITLKKSLNSLSLALQTEAPLAGISGAPVPWQRIV